MEIDFTKFLTWVEIASVISAIAFLILLIKRVRSCWIWGIISSALAVILFVHPEVKLYSEGLLYSVYIVLGVYGYIQWNSDNNELPISEYRLTTHIGGVGIASLVFLGLGYFFSEYTDSNMPYADAFSTSFSFWATFLEARKVLSTWFYWFVLNLFSVWLYTQRSLEFYSVLMLFYAIMSIVGYLKWRKACDAQSISEEL